MLCVLDYSEKRDNAYYLLDKSINNAISIIESAFKQNNKANEKSSN